MAGQMMTEPELGPPLSGSPQNPAREPAKRKPAGRGTVGDTAFMDAVIIVAAAWLALLVLYYSLRNHNV